MAAWEYKIAVREEDNPLSEEELNALGMEGLELVNVAVTQREERVIGRLERRNRFYYFFKRATQSPSTPQGGSVSP